MVKKSKIKIGIIGNPNTGKSTLFNSLTGMRQHVGNWPGKTVEKKVGFFTYKGVRLEVVDLPGAYSLTAYSVEETVSTNFILNEKPDVLIQIIDAQNFERNLFMTTELLEFKVPLVLALNMVDLAKKKGIVINSEKLSEFLDVPVVPIDAKKKIAFDDLLDASIALISKEKSTIQIPYGVRIEKELEKISNFINAKEGDPDIVNRSECFALRLLEKDSDFVERLKNREYYPELNQLVEKSFLKITKNFDADVHSLLTNSRYEFIKKIARAITNISSFSRKRLGPDKIDSVLTNKFAGMPIFLLVIFIIFQITFVLSKPLTDLMSLLFENLGEFVSRLLLSLNFSEWFVSLFVDGIIGGVGGVLMFVPIMGVLFLFMSIMEDSGYMARAAYVMDKLMRRIGLHGKAFIPLILGFGCNVPAIMATRTLESKKDRILTVLITPFMSCGARLPVYALFAGAFFATNQGLVIFSLYILGVFVAILVGMFFKKIFYSNVSSAFIIELPPFRCPSIRTIVIDVFKRIMMFIKKAGTIILAFSILIWFLASLPVGVEYASKDSLVGNIGETISPVFRPLGFDDYKSSVALMFGFVAKEVVVSSFGALYGVDENNPNSEAGLADALHEDFTPLSAYAFMVFILLYVPCISAIAVVKRELNSWKWPLFMIFYTTAVAWVISFLVYRGGQFLGFS